MISRRSKAERTGPDQTHCALSPASGRRLSTGGPKPTQSLRHEQSYAARITGRISYDIFVHRAVPLRRKPPEVEQRRQRRDGLPNTVTVRQPQGAERLVSRRVPALKADAAAPRSQGEGGHVGARAGVPRPSTDAGAVRRIPRGAERDDYQIPDQHQPEALLSRRQSR